MSGRKFYVAMCQVVETVLDADGKIVYEPKTFTRSNGTTYKCNYPATRKVEGRFKGFGAHGKVISVYDSAAKARRYCGEGGFIMELDPADGLKYGCSPEEQMAHCENRMLFWAKEADRLQQELRNGS